MAKKIKNEYFPKIVSYPGETLQDILEETGLTQAEVSRRTGRPTKLINEIIKGKTSITPQTAIQLERVFGLPAEFWNQRQKLYDESVARIKSFEELNCHTDWLKNFKIKNLVKLEWINKYSDPVEQLVELLTFFGVNSPKQWRNIWKNTSTNFRTNIKFETSIYSESAWLRKGEIEASKLHCEKYSKIKFSKALEEIRKLTCKSPEDFIEPLVKLCCDSGIAVVFVPKLPKLPVSGATRWITSSKAILQMSLRGKYEDIFWFTFFHEASHILLHGKRDVFIESNEMEKSKKEIEADEFATNFLIPRERWMNFTKTENFKSQTSVIKFANRLGISPAIIVGRLHYENLVPHSHMNSLRNKFEFTD